MSSKIPETVAANKKIRVAMIIQSYYPRLGGAERQIMSLAPYLEELGAEIAIFTRQYPGMLSEEKIEGVSVNRFKSPGPKFVASLYFSFGALLKIAKEKPDLLHAHELLSPATTAIIAKIFLRIPIVVKVLRGGFLGDIYKVRNGYFSAIRIWLLKQFIDKVISISEEITCELREIGFPEEKIIKIPNGVDSQKFFGISGEEKKIQLSKLELPQGKLIIFSGRLVKEKNVDTLIEIFPKITKEHQNVFLLILGEGPERINLESLAGDNIKFIGQVDNVDQYLQVADLFVLPSSTEGFSNALLEAMACELPVIATRIGGAPDIIAHTHNGILVAPNSKEDLLSAILLYLDKPDRNLGHEARKMILTDYSLEETANKIFSLYTQVISKRD